MVRPLRIEFSGAIYHVTSRGNARCAIYGDDEDRRAFFSALDRVVVRFHWICHAYCLMDNHYHLLIETPEGNLSHGMRQLNGVYTQGFNRRHNRVGHLFQGRFKAIVVDRDSYLLELCRYIVLNPVRAGEVARPEEYRWSSYRATAGLRPGPAFLHSAWVLEQFGRKQGEARRSYQRFVEEGVDASSPWCEVRGQLVLGSPRFMEGLRPLLEGAAPSGEVPKAQRLAHRPTLAEALIKGGWKGRAERDRAVHQTHFLYGYSLSEIGRHLGLHYTTISRIVNKG